MGPVFPSAQGAEQAQHFNGPPVRVRSSIALAPSTKSRAHSSLPRVTGPRPTHAPASHRCVRLHVSVCPGREAEAPPSQRLAAAMTVLCVSRATL